MKYVRLLVGFSFLTGSASMAQTGSSAIQLLRYNDQFKRSVTDSIKCGIDRLRHIKTGNNSFLTLGGELREQYQYFNNLNFGDLPPNHRSRTTGQLWHRMMLHGNWEIGKATRLFIQLNSTFRFFNPNPITPEIDENRLSLHQAFIDQVILKRGLIRLGRQELGYGNNRLLTFREGPNTRLAFDGLVFKWRTVNRSIDLIAITPVVSKQYVLDDESFKEFVFGLYATESVVAKKLLIDYYCLHFRSKSRRYNFMPGDERRQTVGFRVFSQQAVFNYELEFTYQFGRFTQQQIAAYGCSADVNYRLVKKIKLIIGVSANYFTGDRFPNDQRLNTYNLLFSKPSYGLAAPIGSSNIINLHPWVRVNPGGNWAVYAGIYYMFRESLADGTYSPGMAQVRPTPAALFTSTERPIGIQYALETTYALNSNFSIAFDAAYFNAGTYVKATGKGLDITYLAGKATLKF